MKKRNLAVALSAIWLAGCSGGGSCNNCAGGTSVPITLSISASPEYPAGIAQTIPLFIQNTSANDASGLVYEPNPVNTIGVPITLTIPPACSSIQAGGSCLIYANIPAGSVPGTFTVLAMGNASSTSVQNIANSIKKTITQQSSFQTQVTANIGLAANNLNNQALSILPVSQTITVNNSESNTALISVLVESSTPVSNIVLYGNGVALIATPYPTGGSYPNSTVITYTINFPSGTNFPESISATCNGIACSTSAIVESAPVGAGILTITPSSVNLSGGNESQIYTLTNNGAESVNNIILPSLPYGFTLSESANCNTTLTNSYPGNSCSFTISYDPTILTESGNESFNVSYYNGQTQFVAPTDYVNYYPVLLNLSLSGGLNYDCTLGNIGESIQAVINNAYGLNAQTITVNSQLQNNTLGRVFPLSCTVTINGESGACTLLPESTQIYGAGPGVCMGQNAIQLVTESVSPTYSVVRFPQTAPESALYRGYLILESWPTNGNNKRAGYFSTESGNIVAPVGESVVATMIGSYGYDGKKVKIMLPTWVWSTFYPYHNSTSLNTNTESCTVTYVENESPTCTWNSPIVFTLSNGNPVHTHSNYYTRACTYVNSASYIAWAFPSNGNGSFTKPFTARNASQHSGTYSYTFSTGC